MTQKKKPVEPIKPIKLPTLKEIRPTIPKEITPEEMKVREEKFAAEKKEREDKLAAEKAAEQVRRDLRLKRCQDAAEIKSLALSTLRNIFTYTDRETEKQEAMNQQSLTTFAEYSSLANIILASGIINAEVDKS
jgi:hypothetical protein